MFVWALAHWRCDDPVRFATYLLLAALAGALKVRIPRMTGTYSLNFLFVLIGVVDLTLGETVMIAGSSMIVQSVWRPATRPALIQVIFNAAAVSLSAGTSFLAARYGFGRSPVLRFTMAALVYFVINTLLISGVLALVENKDFKTVWAEWFRWSFVYYVAGVLVVAAIVMSSRHFGWIFSLLLLPLMYLEYLCYGVKIAGERDAAADRPY
jgi:hypothetical protein